MSEYRCKNCHKLLFKYNPIIFEDGVLYADKDSKGVVEIVCPKCGEIQTLTQEMILKDWKFAVGSSAT